MRAAFWAEVLPGQFDLKRGREAMGTAYKVVLVDGDGAFHSIAGRGPNLRLIYGIGMVTYPVFGKLFVFDAEEKAQTFVIENFDAWVKYEILECDVIGATYPEPASMIPGDANLIEVLTYWRALSEWTPRVTSIPIPVGTMFCDSVKPLRVCA